MMTKTTLGQLVANLFAKYERRYHDSRFAAIATQVALKNLQRTPAAAADTEELRC